MRGFLIGSALALLVSWGLYQSMMLSYSTYEFHLPWVQIGIAVVVVIAVIVASVMHALRRTRTASVVEALREDTV